MKTFKTILQTEYIGPIIIALLYVDALSAMTGVLNGLVMSLIARYQSHGLQNYSYPYAHYVISVILFSATATGLLLWLYWERRLAEAEPTDDAMNPPSTDAGQA